MVDTEGKEGAAHPLRKPNHKGQPPQKAFRKRVNLPASTTCLPCLPVVTTLRYASALIPDMARANKLLDQILRGGADANISFSGMVQLLKRLGFQERIKGSHHIFYRDGVAEILNLQPQSGKCKPYQVKQVRNVIINYRLAGEADD